MCRIMQSFANDMALKKADNSHSTKLNTDMKFKSPVSGRICALYEAQIAQQLKANRFKTLSSHFGGVSSDFS